MVVLGENQSIDGGNELESVPTRFTIQDTECKLLVTCTSSADRILWLRKLEEARKHFLLTERAVLQRQRSSNHQLFYFVHILLFDRSYFIHEFGNINSQSVQT